MEKIKELGMRKDSHAISIKAAISNGVMVLVVILASIAMIALTGCSGAGSVATKEITPIDEQSGKQDPADWAVPVFNSDDGTMHWSDGTPLEREMRTSEGDFNDFVSLMIEANPDLAYAYFEDMGNGVAKITCNKDMIKRSLSKVSDDDTRWIQVDSFYLPFGPSKYDTIKYDFKFMQVVGTEINRETHELAENTTVAKKASGVRGLFGGYDADVERVLTGGFYEGDALDGDPMFDEEASAKARELAEQRG